MSLGTQPKALDATAAKPADHPAPPVQPKWDVSHHEVLNQIKQDRAAQNEVRTAAAIPQPHRDVPAQPQPQHPRVEVQRPVAPVAPIAQPMHGGQQQQWRHRENGTQTLTQTQTQPTEINRTVINNNQRYEFGNNGQNNSNNNQKYLYGALAGGAVLGGAALYANRDNNYRDYSYGQNYNVTYSDPYRNLNSGYAYNQYNQYDQYNLNNQNSQYDQYALNNQFNQYNPSSQFGLGGYDATGNYADNTYLNGVGTNYDLTANNSDFLYGGTTYGGTPFDGGYNRPIYETTGVQDYRPVYQEVNPIAAIPQLFGGLIGGIIGNITNSNHKRYYPDNC